MTPSSLLLRMLRDAAAGILHLHEEGVIHRDIAARNFLLASDFTVVISDFGTSRVCESEEDGGSTVSNVGPVRWMAPEALRDSVYSASSDVWSFAAFLVEILTKNVPYAGIPVYDVAAKVISQEITLVECLSVHVDTLLYDLVVRCSKVDPSERATMAEVLKLLNDASALKMDEIDEDWLKLVTLNSRTRSRSTNSSDSDSSQMNLRTSGPARIPS